MANSNDEINDIALAAAMAAAEAQPTMAPTIETAAHEPADATIDGRPIHLGTVGGYAAALHYIGESTYDAVYDLDLALTKRAKYHAMVRHAAETLAAVQEVEGNRAYMDAEREVVRWAVRVADARNGGDVSRVADAQEAAPNMRDILDRMDAALDHNGGSGTD